MAESPIEIHSPCLEAVDVHPLGHSETVADMRVSTPMHDKRYTIRVANPSSLQKPYQPIHDKNVLSACFDPSCTLLRIFADRGTVEFWGNDGFHRSIRGTNLELD